MVARPSPSLMIEGHDFSSKILPNKVIRLFTNVFLSYAIQQELSFSSLLLAYWKKLAYAFIS